VIPVHGELVVTVPAQSHLQVMCQAMMDPNRATDDALRKPYHKLFATLERHESIFSPQQQAHLGCWKLWVLLRLQLFTDDSFVFNKVARNVQELIVGLPEVSGEEEEETCERLQVGPP
jgi:hypothetical protein